MEAGVIDITPKPTISVCIITYNHERYIAKCIQEVLEQARIYDLEIVIGDDASTDKTREIINEISKDHPNIIKLLHDKNIGGCENYKSIHRAARGEYVVHIDGDDYMYPNRIKEQIDFLIQNPDCSAVVHQLDRVDQANDRLGDKWPNNFKKNKYDINEILLLHPLFGHSSLTFRRSSLTNFLSKNIEKFIDFEIYLELSKKGKIGAINKSLGAYRVAVGISTGRNLYQLAIEAIERSATGFASKKVIDKALARQYFLFAKRAFVDEEFELMKKLISGSLHYEVIDIMQLTLFLFKNNPAMLHRLYKLSKQ
jgi:glycosyltransferase involved in cell wall biosynthesis